MKITVSKTLAELTDFEQLTSGMIGKTVEAEFSDEWAGLTKVAVFSNGETCIDVINPSGTITIPWEVLAVPNKTVYAGFYGYTVENGEKALAIPTIYAELGRVRKGADPSNDSSTLPSPTTSEQIQAAVNCLEQRIGNLEEYNIENDKIHSLDSEDELDDEDEFPFYKHSEACNRKTTWENMRLKMKEYFDTLYRTFDPQHTFDDEIASRITELKAKADRRLTNLEYVSRGFIFREDVDHNNAYTKIVNSDIAPWATIDSIGGHSEVVDGEIVHAIVDKVVSRNIGNDVLYTYEIPDTVKTLDGFGWGIDTVYNEVDLENEKYIKRVDRVDMGTLSWSFASTSAHPYFFSRSINNVAKADGKSINPRYANTPKNTNNDLVCYINTANANVVVRDDSLAGDTKAFTAAMHGVYLYYELAEPTETDISAYLTEENVIDVEPNGTITFEQDNATQLAVPNAETFVVDLNNYLEVEIAGKVDINQGPGHANEILVVDSNGKVTTKPLDTLLNLG